MNKHLRYAVTAPQPTIPANSFQHPNGIKQRKFLTKKRLESVYFRITFSIAKYPRITFPPLKTVLGCLVVSTKAFFDSSQSQKYQVLPIMSTWVSEKILKQIYAGQCWKHFQKVHLEVYNNLDDSVGSIRDRISTRQ